MYTGVKLGRPPEAQRCAIEVALGFQGIPKAYVCKDLPGVKLDRPPVAPLGAFEVVNAEEDVRQTKMAAEVSLVMFDLTQII